MSRIDLSPLSRAEAGDGAPGSAHPARGGLPAPAPSRLREGEVWREFPGLRTSDASRWHYLDSAATAQKPQAVIDAVSRALGADYATVHRGVYTRSAEMTLGYEAARQRVATFLRAAS